MADQYGEVTYDISLMENQNQNTKNKANVPLLDENDNFIHPKTTEISNETHSLNHDAFEYTRQQYVFNYKGKMKSFVLCILFVLFLCFAIQTMILHYKSENSFIILFCAYATFALSFSFLLLSIFDYLILTKKDAYNIPANYHIVTYSITFFLESFLCVIYALMIPTIVYKQISESFFDLYNNLDGVTRILIITLFVNLLFILFTTIVVIISYCNKGNYTINKIRRNGTRINDDSEQ